MKEGIKLMRFIGYYGCSQETNEIALEANSLESANEYVLECACESYDGYHYDEYVSEEDECEVDEAREDDIEYHVEPFNCLNPEHRAILKAQENEFWRV